MKKKQKQHVHGIRGRRTSDCTDGGTSSPDYKKGRYDLNNQCSSQKDNQSRSKARSSGSCVPFRSMECTQHAPSPVLFGKVAHSRCTEHGSSYDESGSANNGAVDFNQDESERSVTTKTAEDQSEPNASYLETARSEPEVHVGDPGTALEHSVEHGRIQTSGSCTDSDKIQPVGPHLATQSAMGPGSAQLVC